MGQVSEPKSGREGKINLSMDEVKVVMSDYSKYLNTWPWQKLWGQSKFWTLIREEQFKGPVMKKVKIIIIFAFYWAQSVE